MRGPRGGAWGSWRRLADALSPFLELTRAFLVPSAAADAFAGFALASLALGLAPRPAAAAAAAVASALLYAAGAATNDLFDRAKDRISAPGRPLPSGRISPRAAAIAAGALAASGAALAGALGAAWPATAIVAAAFLYDAGAKRIPIAGSLLLGACRGANLLLGAAAAGGRAALGDRGPLAGAAAIALYASGITAASRSEDSGRRGPFLLAAALVLAVPLAVGLARPSDPAVWVHAAAVAVAAGSALGAGLGREAVRRTAARFVARALGAISFLDAAAVLALAPPGSRRWPWLAPLYALWLIAAALRRARAARGLPES